MFSAPLTPNTQSDCWEAKLSDSGVVRSPGWGQPCHLIPDILQRTVQHLETAADRPRCQEKTHKKSQVSI